MKATLKGFEHRLETVNGIQIHAVVGGAGSPVALLHGFPQTWWEWRTAMPLLAEHHTLVVPDLRGAGFSDCPPGGYDKVTMAADVHALMSKLGHERYAVVGHDIGGMVGNALAFSQRDAVTHLAVLDVALPGWSKWEETFGRLWWFGFHSKPDLPERLIYGREYEYIYAFIAERVGDFGTFDPADIEIFARAFALPGRTRAAMEWYRAFPADHSAISELKTQKLTIPVLGLGGERRYGGQMAEILREFATDVRGGSVAGAGHYVAEDRPTETAVAILNFLA